MTDTRRPNIPNARPRPALVVLAAGASSRLGSCKALVELRARAPRTPLEHALVAGAAFDGAPPLVVSGADHRRLVRALPAGAALIQNPRWGEGRTGSVAVAVAARAGLDLCLSPVDVPLVPRSVYDTLLAAWLEAGSPSRGWLAPVRGGRHGHPVLIGRALLEEVAGLAPSMSLRALRERAEPRFDVAVDAPEIHDDLDTPADLERLRRRFSR